MVKNSSYYDYVLYINCAKYNHSEKLKHLEILLFQKLDMCFYVEEVKNDVIFLTRMMINLFSVLRILWGNM